MHDLTAQVTSSLLPFPGVTINALGEDEITLDSVLQGKFTVGRSGLGWLACGPHLEAVHAVTGERLSAYTFSSGGEHPPCILAAKDFGWLKRSGLLIGLEETEGSVLCLYDLGLSRVVKAVVIPGRITAIEPLVSYGGASTSTQHLHQSLRWFFGIAAVGTDLGHVLLVDLCLDDLSCNQNELEASDLQVVTKSPAEIPKLREVSSREGRHLCLQLNGATGVGATALQYISRTNQLAVGFSDGCFHLWNMKTLKKEYHSQLEGGKVPVNAFTFQEPENDPRNCCYLWAVQSSQDLEGDMVSLRLLQLAFSERKCSASGKILYEGLEYCEERYSQELSGTAFPLRTQATNTRLLSCQTIEKFRPHLDRDDSMNEVASPDTSVSIFSWQVRAYGQGTPATYIGVFDINRWYHAQMPDSLRAGESLQNCPYLAVWSLDAVMQMVAPHVLLDVVVNDRSLSRGLPYTCPPPEQYFNPTTYNFDATCLLNTGIVHLTCSGYQKETLGFLKKAAPCSSDVISSSYSRCLMSGLLSSRLADAQASSVTQEEQLDAILCTAVETSSLGLITGCIKQWTAEEQPGSALNLRYILDWAWNKVVQTKEELDGICAPLFDSSSNFTDPQTMQLLQHSQRLLTNLSTIFHCLLSEAQELTQKGLVGLMNKNMVSSLISKYAQVVLWFCRTGLLPEGSDEDALQISRPFYSHSVISNYYTIRREELNRLAKGKWCADCLMIDGLVGQCGDRLVNLWRRDEGGTGQYPPPTLHALLDIYLLDNIDEAAKHAIVIYLLLDVMYAFSNKEGASVESFPTAFAIPIGLVKLIQGLWLLDHHDHQSAFELLLHPAASPCQFVWQHERILQALMCQGQHTEALRYFHVTKPPIASTSQAKLCLSVLLHNRCLIEAWTLIRLHSNRLNISELLGFLYETCQELGLIKELLKLPLGLSEQDGLEKFLQGTGGLQNRELLMVHYLQQANYIPALQLNQTLKMNLVNERDPKLKQQSNTRNSILDQYGKVLPRVQRKLATERAKPYQHPHIIHKEVSRPQPLSTITKRSANEKVISRAGFINNVLTKIEEVWIGKGVSPQSSPSKSPKASELKSPGPASCSAFPEPFLGTPITMSAKRKSRLMKLVVQPSCPMPQSLLSPPRPPSSWVSPKSISKASELSLLRTPQVVKRARALAASGPVFAAFTPQSILRSSLRPTPVATPSASPGRSITPPLRKENRITFIEEAESPEVEKGIHWTNGEAADDEISLLTRGALLSKATRKSWSSHEEEDVQKEEPQLLPPDGGIPSPHLSVSNPPSIHEDSEETKPQLVSSFETSEMSVRSTDTTLEFYDAPLSEEQEKNKDDNDDDDDDRIVSIKAPPNQEGTLQSMFTSEQVDHEQEVPEEEEQHEEDVKYTDTVESNSAHEATNENDVPAENMDEEILIKVCAEQEAAVTAIEQDTSTHGGNEVIEDSNSQAEDVCDQPTVQNEQFCITESAEIEAVKPSEDTEPTDEPEPEVEHSADLTEFVQRHLFGDDLSSPLTRSGIHSLPRTSISEALDQGDDEEEEAPASTAPVFASQKSTTSITSSEPTGTDSHSVVSVNDSEELSRPVSGDDEDDEEEEEEEESDDAEEEEEEEEDDEEEGEDEEEDSGSEVEIIEEIQGRPPPLVESTEFEIQGQSHFLPNLSEQEAEAFSSEMKTADEDAVGEVVMVRVSTDGEMDQDEEEDQDAAYVELKPSTTLLVPLELVEGQDALMNAADPEPNEIFQAALPNDLKTESQSSFSLTLDLEEDWDKEPIENNLLPTNVLQFEVNEFTEDGKVVEKKESTTEEPMAIPEVEVAEEKESTEEPVAIPEVEVVETKESTEEPVAIPEVEVVETKESTEEPMAIPEVEVVEEKESTEEPMAIPEVEVVEENESTEEPMAIPEVEVVEEKESTEEPVAIPEVEVVEKKESTEEPVAIPEVQVVETKESTEEPVAIPEVEVVEEKESTEEPVSIPEVEVVEEKESTEEPVSIPEVEVVEEKESTEEPVAILEVEVVEEKESTEEPVSIPELEVVETKESTEEPVSIPEVEVVETKESTEEPVAIPEVEVVENVDLPDTAILEESGEKELECLEMDTPVESNEELPNGESIFDNNEQVEHEKAEIQTEEQIPEPVQDMCNEKDIQDTTAADAVVEEDETEPSDKPTEPEELLKEDKLMPNTEGIHAEQEDIVPVDASKEQEEEMEMREEKKDTIEDDTKKQEFVVALEKHVDAAPDDQPVLETPGSGRKSRAPYAPSLRTTRASRTVSFISPVTEETLDTAEGKNEVEVKKAVEQEAVTAFPTSPSRSTRRSKQVKENIISTPRRSTRKTKAEPQPEPQLEVELEPKSEQEDKVDTAEIVCDNTVPSTTRTLSPGRGRASQRSSTRTSIQISSEVEGVNTESEIKQGADVFNAVTKSSGRGKTPTKRKAAQSNTPRRSSRRTVNASEEAPQPLEILEEVEEQEERVRPTPAKQISKKSKAEPMLPAPVEEENDGEHLTPSPARRTRQSSRITLSVYPQVKLVPISIPQSLKKRAKKDQGQYEPEPLNDGEAISKTKKLWDQPEDELPLLHHPLEVDSETPVADALIKRLQDDKEQHVSRSITRTSKRRTKSVVDPGPPVENSLAFDLDKSGPGESSFIYSPSRRRNAAKRAESPHHSERAAPVTRSRRKVSTADAVASQDEMAVEDKAEEPGVSHTRKNSKRATKSKAVWEPALIAEVDLLTPLPSPVDPVPRAQKRTKEAEGPTSTMNLRRKRIMDTVLTKPVTRRKKL